MNRLWVLTIFCAFFIATPEGAIASDAKTLVKEGDKKEAQFDNVAAFTLYKSATAADEKNFEAAYKAVGALINVGEDFLDDGGDEARKRYEEATTMAEDLVKGWPDEALSHYYYALASGKLAQSRGARRK